MVETEANAQHSTLNVQRLRQSKSETLGRAPRLRLVTGLVGLLCIVGCEKQSGEAIVLEKEHIAAAVPVGGSRGNSEGALDKDQPQAFDADEIAVDSYVMRPEDRGTSRDPRALREEQWLVKVRMIDGGRTFNVQANRVQFDRLKAGDRVQVRYRIGKYTKTIWSAEILESKK